MLSGTDGRIAPCAPQSDRRDALQPGNRQSGTLISIDGSRAVVATRMPSLTNTAEPYWSVGTLITVYGQHSRVICFVRDMGIVAPPWNDSGDNPIHANVELLGEIVDGPGGRPEFRRGIARYPVLGAAAHRIRKDDLLAIYDLGGRKGSEIGALSQDTSIPAAIDVEGMLRKHFAVVGTTGVGKSCSVSILLRTAITERPTLRVIIVDPHNEYTNAFRDVAHTVDSDKFELPFWLFRFEEIVDVIYRGARAPADEVEFLRDAIMQAKEMYHSREQSLPGSILKKTLRSEGGTHTADSPQPYRMTDILALIDGATGRLEQKFDRASLRSLRGRIESLGNDPSYRFMFGKTAIDGMSEAAVRGLFRLTDSARPITILQLAGIPADVVNASVSVLARLAFDLSTQSRGAYEILLACEEAHRYVPADASLGFAPTRRALARIAKEGRKYGCYLAVVTQRPSELDPTILSQCSTVFAMRLANKEDQAIMRAAMPDAATGVLDFLSALSNREAIGFGEAFSTPMRFMFRLTDVSALPRMQDSEGSRQWLLADQAGSGDFFGAEKEHDAAAMALAPEIAVPAVEPATPTPQRVPIGTQAGASSYRPAPVAAAPPAPQPQAAYAPPPPRPAPSLQVPQRPASGFGQMQRPAPPPPPPSPWPSASTDSGYRVK
jgi:DNA helicase HerA-like ATPase